MSNENGPVHMEGLWEALAAPEGPWLLLCTVLPEIRRWAFSSLDVSDTQGHRKDSNLGLCDCTTGSEPQTGDRTRTEAKQAAEAPGRSQWLQGGPTRLPGGGHPQAEKRKEEFGAEGLECAEVGHGEPVPGAAEALVCICLCSQPARPWSSGPGRSAGKAR